MTMQVGQHVLAIAPIPLSTLAHLHHAAALQALHAVHQAQCLHTFQTQAGRQLLNALLAVIIHGGAHQVGHQEQVQISTLAGAKQAGFLAQSRQTIQQFTGVQSLGTGSGLVLLPELQPACGQGATPPPWTAPGHVQAAPPGPGQGQGGAFDGGKVQQQVQELGAVLHGRVG